MVAAAARRGRRLARCAVSCPSICLSAAAAANYVCSCAVCLFVSNAIIIIVSRVTTPPCLLTTTTQLAKATESRRAILRLLLCAPEPRQLRSHETGWRCGCGCPVCRGGFFLAPDDTRSPSSHGPSPMAHQASKQRAKGQRAARQESERERRPAQGSAGIRNTCAKPRTWPTWSTSTVASTVSKTCADGFVLRGRILGRSSRTHIETTVQTRTAGILWQHILSVVHLIAMQTRDAPLSSLGRRSATSDRSLSSVGDSAAMKQPKSNRTRDVVGSLSQTPQSTEQHLCWT